MFAGRPPVRQNLCHDGKQEVNTVAALNSHINDLYQHHTKEGLNFIGFKNISLLFKTMGQADIRFVIRHFNNMGLSCLASLFQSAELLNSILERKRTGCKQKNSKKSNNNLDPKMPDNLTCLYFKTDSEGQCLNRRILGFRDKFGLFQNAPDPPPNFRSLSLIGSIYDKDLEKRNQKSLFSIWKDLQLNNYNPPAFEMSARNGKELSKWILNDAATPICLLDQNNIESPAPRILPIIYQSKRSEHIFKTLVEKAKSFCSKMAKEHGPGSPIYKPNIFVSWLSARTKVNNGKALCAQILNCKFGELQSSAIQKLEKAGIKGKIDNKRIARGLMRGTRAFNSAKTQRATIELSLAAMRNAKDISRISSSPEKPCFVCGCYESSSNPDMNIFSLERNFYRHVFVECSIPCFLSQLLKALSVQIFGFPIEISLQLILMNEISHSKYKNTNEDQRKVWFSILNCYKATIYSLYYLRPKFLDAKIIVNRFNHNLDVVRKIAQNRSSKLMDNVCIPKTGFCRFKSFERIHKLTMLNTRALRNVDNINRRREYLYEYRDRTNLNLNAPRRGKASTYKAISGQKRQALITKFFSKIEKKKLGVDGEIDLVSSIC